MFNTPLVFVMVHSEHGYYKCAQINKLKCRFSQIYFNLTPRQTEKTKRIKKKKQFNL